MDYGILSVVPPLVAIILALVLKDIFIALMLGIFSASIIINGWGFLPPIVSKYILESGIKGNATIITVLLFFGPLIALMKKSGGFEAYARWADKHIRSKYSALMYTWLASLVCFINTTMSTIGVGVVMRQITDRYKVPREKLGMILSCSGPPAEALVPITLWIIFYGGVISKAIPVDGTKAFINAIPFNFYSLISIVGAFLIGAGVIPDFGLIKKAVMRSEKTGDLIRPDSSPMDAKEIAELEIAENTRVSFLAFIIPLLVAVAVVIFSYLTTKRVKLDFAIFCAFLAAVIVAMAMGSLKLRDITGTFFIGVKSIIPAVVIIILAVALAASIKDVGFAPYLIRVSKGFISGWWLPLSGFIIACVTSFATGSSSGTVAILAPLVLPLAASLNAPISLTIAAIFGGALFGDESSPVSDMAVKSAMGAGVDVADLVAAQLPYKLIFAVLALVGYVIASLIWYL